MKQINSEARQDERNINRRFPIGPSSIPLSRIFICRSPTLLIPFCGRLTCQMLSWLRFHDAGLIGLVDASPGNKHGADSGRCGCLACSLLFFAGDVKALDHEPKLLMRNRLDFFLIEIADGVLNPVGRWTIFGTVALELFMQG